MNTQEMTAVMSETQAGQLTFPECVRRLSQIGVESYFVDFASNSEILYTSAGETHTAAVSLPRSSVASNFSQPDLVSAIRGAQTDTIRYPEFVRRATAAGVIAYWAFLSGRRVIYFGRKGELHTEEFPAAKS